MRVFLALNLPPELQPGLQRAVDYLKQDFRGRVKWTRPDQYHITLRFFGEVPEGEISRLIATSREITGQFPKFDLSFEELGAFPQWARPRVLWARFGGKIVMELHRAIQEATTTFGVPPDDRPFSPHLTLGRVREGRFGRKPEPRGSFEIPVWRVPQVDLMQSVLGKDGPSYSSVAAMPMGEW